MQNSFLLRLVHALREWKHFLLGSCVLIYTDNATLRFWRNAQNLTPRQVRWVAYMQMFDLEVTHIPGKDNTAADALSSLHVLLPLQSVHDNWKSAYLADPNPGPKDFTHAGDLVEFHKCTISPTPPGIRPT